MPNVEIRFIYGFSGDVWYRVLLNRLEIVHERLSRDRRGQLSARGGSRR